MSNGMVLRLILMWRRLIYGENLAHSLLIRRKDIYRASSEKRNWSCATLRMVGAPTLVKIGVSPTSPRVIFFKNSLSCDLKNHGDLSLSTVQSNSFLFESVHMCSNFFENVISCSMSDIENL